MEPTVQLARKHAGEFLHFDITSDKTKAEAIAKAKELGIWESIKDFGGTAYAIAVNKDSGKVSAKSKKGSQEVADYDKVMAEVN